jgi:hypothetical protein
MKYSTMTSALIRLVMLVRVSKFKVLKVVLYKAAGECPPPLEPAPESRSQGERSGSALPERSPSRAFLRSALPHQKQRSLVFEGALRERSGNERSQGKKTLPETLPEPARVRRRKLIIFWFFFGFFGEMTHGKGSLGLAKTTKHSFTPISLILFHISSISLLRGF